MISQAITTILDITPEQYWNEYVKRYMNWLQSHCGNTDADFQKLLSNTAINGWYNRHHEDVELQAIEVLKHQYQSITIDKVREIYHVMMVDVFKAYPKHLFEVARKLSITNDPHNHDHTAN